MLTIKFHAIRRYQSRVDPSATDRKAWEQILRAAKTGMKIPRENGRALVVSGRLRVAMEGRKVLTVWKQTRPDIGKPRNRRSWRWTA